METLAAQPIDPAMPIHHCPAMAASEYLLGSSFVGMKGKVHWDVTEKLAILPNQSPGHFSVGYKVKDESGREAFMKASDLSMFNSPGGDALRSLLAAANAHEFERRILERCRGNNMDRVVTALDFGDYEIVHDGVRDRIFFLIFELANGDLRKYVERREGFDLLWIVGAINNLAVAVSQLHTGEIYHNDIKPANALVFEAVEKIADLGRATTPHIGIDHDGHLCAGDLRFAPPEQIYPSEQADIPLTKFQRFRAGDLYNLGSLAHYLVTGRMITPEIISRLNPEHQPRNISGGWQDSYAKALPYWRAAISSMMQEVWDALPDNYPLSLKKHFEQLVGIIEQLTDPDPIQRGNIAGRVSGYDQYSLERYISALNLLRQRIAVDIRSAK